MQLLILRRIIKLTAVCLVIHSLLFPSLSSAQNTVLTTSFTKAQKGEISITELVDLIVDQVLKSPVIGPEVGRLKSQVPGFAETAAPIFIAKIQGLIAAGQFEEAWAIKSLSDNVIPNAWPEGRRISQIFDAVSKIETIKNNNDIRGLSALSISNLGSEDAKAIEASMKFVAEEFLDQAINDKDQFSAIKKMADLAVSFPDLPLKEKASEIFKKIAENQDASGEWSFDNPSVQQFVLDNFSENKQALFKIYQTKILNSLKEGNQNRASIYYNAIVPQLNEDEKNELRKEILNVGLKTGLNPFVISRIDELKAANKLSPIKKLVLIFKGYYGWIPLVVPILILLPLIKLFRRREKAQKRYAPKVSDDEYTTLLKRLNLDEDASEAQIKKAFRQMVKEHHPDAHGASGVVVNSDGKVDQKFEELRKTYDRIMEMRKSWFGANK